MSWNVICADVATFETVEGVSGSVQSVSNESVRAVGALVVSPTLPVWGRRNSLGVSPVGTVPRAFHKSREPNSRSFVAAKHGPLLRMTAFLKHALGLVNQA